MKIRFLKVVRFLSLLGLAVGAVTPRAYPQTPARLAVELFGGYARLSVTGAVGAVYSIQYTTDLAETNLWHNLAIFPLPSSPYQWVDTTVPATGRRFFRAVSTNAAPFGLTNMVWIGPGTFTLGSPTNEAGRYTNEGPQTVVTLTRGFFMSKYEVTQGEYLAVTGSNPSFFNGFQTNFPAPPGGTNYGNDLTRPVEQVSWFDATNYCGRLTAREQSAGRLPTGWVYRLPTEAEWEYASRAGTTTRYSFGDDPGYTQLANYAWYETNSGTNTHPVGQKQPNPWGLDDMHGNVYEWCQDWYTNAYPGGFVTDPQGPLAGTNRMARGGSYFSSNVRCRSAMRLALSPTEPFTSVGFRIVLAPGQPWTIVPTIAEQPRGVATNFGATVSFSVTAPGAYPLTYQWQFNSNNLPLATGSKLTLASVQSADVGSYCVIVSNAYGAVTSQVAALVVDTTNLVWVPAGYFIMGTLLSELHPDDEEPRTVVTLTRGFFMGKYEVTQGEYLEVRGTNPSQFNGDLSRPVEQVSWFDATNYCGQLTAREQVAGRLPTGWVYRLPTEAEWEYACRAGTATRYSFGDDWDYTQLANYAWYEANSGLTTHPVGQKLPNPWGLYDMHGNVYEWCQDWYADAYPGGFVTDPQGPATGTKRVARGGGFYSSAFDYCRSASRNFFVPADTLRNRGFRVVLAPSQP